MNDKFEDTEIYPASASALGTNAYSMDYCNTIGHRPAYCACLNRISNRENGKQRADAECSPEIDKGSCPAFKMRKKELDAGQAIYFINRKKLNVYNVERADESESRVMALVSKREDKVEKRKKSAPPATVEHTAYNDSVSVSARLKAKEEVKPSSPLAEIGDYAAAINKAIANSAIGTASVQMAPNHAASAPVKAGMSLLEMARMKMAAKAVQPQP